ncbi:mitogen-activated protein kinase kinase kinase 18 [Dendrobium catenatum]|uniref:Mitogen-activated protein kinase kinase kinase 2 n=1 Tax=Dendrobium catenatum TaxID=906689 RepID=A0A2I0X2Y2_9ASPA|nr:mitogen-activated protein kinase kinase kinase 18 [Dendrobium catenatum]PKU82257.1 Mitogen-activated protein kinase kinase kinase 2 [Dendrobium catenatum]
MERRWARGGIIGKGSFGTVSLAVDRSNGTIFAVKSIKLNSSPPRALAALENEIRLLSSLNSPHVVSYLGDDVTEEPDGLWRNLLLEYLPGGTAADLAATGKMMEADVRSCTRSIAQALHFLHTTAGVVHGDVKGRNVILGSPTGMAKLADFGTASKGLGEAARGAGTPLWMAPEVARGEAATPASDVWSLGCTVIEMLSGGRQPWEESGIADVRDPPVQMFRVGFCEVLPEFPPWLSKTGQDFLDKCIRRDPSERWTCEQLLQHSFLADSPEPSPRSVFELGKLEREFEDDEDGAAESYTENENCAVELARERIRELGSSAVEWRKDGWEEVRSAVEKKSSGVGEYNGKCRCLRVVGNVGISGANWFLGLFAPLFFILICCIQILVYDIACNFFSPLCSSVFCRSLCLI